MNPNTMRDKLSTIATTVHLVDRDVEVRVTNPSLVAWDITRADKGWPAADAAPMLWLTFLAWDALCRAGDYPRGEGKATTFAKFRDEDCLKIDEPEDDETDPTKTAAADGSPSLSASEPASTGTGSTKPATSS